MIDSYQYIKQPAATKLLQMDTVLTLKWALQRNKNIKNKGEEGEEERKGKIKRDKMEEFKEWESIGERKRDGMRD